MPTELRFPPIPAGRIPQNGRVAPFQPISPLLAGPTKVRPGHGDSGREGGLLRQHLQYHGATHEL